MLPNFLGRLSSQNCHQMTSTDGRTGYSESTSQISRAMTFRFADANLFLRCGSTLRMRDLSSRCGLILRIENNLSNGNILPRRGIRFFPTLWAETSSPISISIFDDWPAGKTISAIMNLMSCESLNLKSMLVILVLVLVLWVRRRTAGLSLFGGAGSDPKFSKIYVCGLPAKGPIGLLDPQRTR